MKTLCIVLKSPVQAGCATQCRKAAAQKGTAGMEELHSYATLAALATVLDVIGRPLVRAATQGLKRLGSDKVFALLGYTPSQAIRALWEYTVAHRDRPDEVRAVLEDSSSSTTTNEAVGAKLAMLAAGRNICAQPGTPCRPALPAPPTKTREQTPTPNATRPACRETTMRLLLDTNVWLDNYIPDRANHQLVGSLLTKVIKQQHDLFYPLPSAKDVFYLIGHTYKQMTRIEGDAA